MTTQESKGIYRLALDYPPKLRALLTEARDWRQPVALVAINDRVHTKQHKVGVPTVVTGEGVTLRMADGAECKVPLWQVEICALIEEGAWAA